MKIHMHLLVNRIIEQKIFNVVLKSYNTNISFEIETVKNLFQSTLTFFIFENFFVIKK